MTVADRNVRIVIAADVAQAIRGLSQVQTGLGGIGQGAEQAQRQTSTMGDVMKGALGAAGIQAGISGIVGGFKSMVSSGLDYEKSANTFQAVTQANSDQMKMMADTAKALGSDIKIPGASAQSAAAAMTELAKGGLTAQQAMEAARGTMILAAAASIDGAQAAEIQANALNAFGLEADQAGRVANVLANVANQSSGEISDFSQGLSQSAAVAHMMGMTVEDTATALGIFANAGLKGSDAGTSLKSSITQLLNPSEQSAQAIAELGLTVWDAQGNFVGYRAIVDQLAQAQGRMTQEAFTSAAAQVLGTDAVRAGAIVAAGGVESWDAMAAALGNVNGAADVAAANSKGLTGVIDALKNTVDTASLTLFESLQPSIMKVAEAATGLIGPLAEGLAPVLSAVADTATNSLAPAMSGLSGVISAVAAPVAGLVSWISELPSPIGVGVLALGGVIALRGPLTATFAAWTGSAGTLIATLRGTAGAAAAGSAGLAGWIASLRAATGASATFGVVAKGALSVLGGPIGLAIIGVTTALGFMAMGSDDAAGATEDLTAAVDANTGALNANAKEVLSKAAADSGALARYKELGGNVADYTEALAGNVDKQKLVRDTLNGATEAAEDAGIAYDAAAVAGEGMGVSAQGSSSVVGEQAGKFNTASEAGKEFESELSAVTAAQNTGKLAAEGAGKAIDGVGNAAGDAEKAVSPFVEAVKASKDAASEADTATQFLTISLLRLAGSTISAEQLARANAAAFRDVAAASRDLAAANSEVSEKQAELAELTLHVGRTLDGEAVSASNLAVTQADVDAAARALADAQAGVADATDNVADSTDKAGQSARDMTAAAYNQAAATGSVKDAIAAATVVMEQQREQFILSAIDADTDRAAAERLADAQGLIPRNVATTYQSNAENAKQRVDELNAALDKIQDRTVRYSIIGTEVTAVGTMRATLGEKAVYAGGGWIGLAGGGVAASGWVHGPGGPTDDLVVAEGPGGKPVRVSPDEFVVKAAQARKHAALLEAINAGTMGFADGGSIANVAGGSAGASAAVAVQGAVSVPDAGAIESAWTAISAAVATAWTAVIQPVLDALSVATLRTSTEFLALQTESVEPSWAANSSTINDTVNVGILPAYDVLNAGTRQVGEQTHALFDGAVAPVWSQTGALINATWAGPIATTYAALNAGSANVGGTFQQLAGNTAVSWGQIGSTITGTYNGSIVPAWAGVQGFATATGGFFTGVASGVSTATGQVTSDIREITGAIDEFFKMVDGKAPATATPAVSATLGGGLATFADGGLLSGPGGPREDKLVIRASPGEFVVNAKATAEHLPELTAINNGGSFADGGLVGDKIGANIRGAIESGAQKAVGAGVDRIAAAMAPANTAGGFASNGNWGPGVTGAFAANTAAAKAYIEAHFGGVSSIGGLYGGSVSGSDHPMGKALDVMIANYRSAAGIASGDSIADWFINNPNSFGTKYVIWRDRINQGGSWAPYSHPSGNNDTLQHRDHVHLSFLTGTGAFQGAAVAPAPDDDPEKSGWLAQMIAKIKAGGTGAGAAGVGVSGSGAAAMNTVDPIRDHGPQNMARGTMAMVGPVPPGGAEERWRPMVEAILTLKGKPLGANTTRAMYQMHTESGGDPLAYNDWDSNFTAGHPSKSLWQTIPGTFRRWADPGFNTNIWHPESNFRAASNYVDANYDGIFPGRAYDNGGPVPPGFSMVYNGTGKDEMTLTNSQWQTARAATLGVGNSSSGVPNVTVTNYMDWANQDVRTEVIVDGKLVELAGAITRQRMQTV